MTIYTEYIDKPAREFEGITVDDLHKGETVFEVNIVVYELGDDRMCTTRSTISRTIYHHYAHKSSSNSQTYMFKDAISVPGLTLLYLFDDLPSNTFFTAYNVTSTDLHHLIKDNIVGGQAIIFHRYHEKNVTKIRGGETCRSIVGYDANALYPWALCMVYASS